MSSDIIAIIPVAGVGTRLRPHTHTQPKVLLHVAGKPILAHILDDLPAARHPPRRADRGLHGRPGARVRRTRTTADLEVAYVEQPERLGLGHAVSLAEPYAGDGTPCSSSSATRSSRPTSPACWPAA